MLVRLLLGTTPDEWRQNFGESKLIEIDDTAWANLQTAYGASIKDEVKMKNVILYTESGEHVVSGQVPFFDVPPAVLIWGDRVFLYSATDDEGVDSYVECFAVALVWTK